MDKLIGLCWVGAICVGFVATALGEPDFSWMSYEWVEEGPTAKKLELSIATNGVEKTLANYLRCAEDGDAEALFYLAYWKMEGLVMERDISGSLRALKKSAELGCIYAQVMLGVAYFGGEMGLEPDAENALLWLTQGSAEGDAFAEFAMAVFLLEGDHQYVNEKTGVEWLRKAAEKGSADAQVHLAFCYANGTGMDADLENAAYWMGRAANQGQPIAQLELGFYYYHGRLEGITNLSEAVEWIGKAANQGHPEAEYALAGLYARGEGVSASRALALKWGQRAAGHGHLQAEVEMAKAYITGSGVRKDVATAASWFLKAAEQGDRESQEALMYLYAFGDGVETNQIEATVWALKAAIQGSINAQIRLIHAYGTGLGIQKDQAEAYAWAIIASRNDTENHKKTIETLISVDDKISGHRRARVIEKEIATYTSQPVNP